MYIVIGSFLIRLKSQSYKVTKFMVAERSRSAKFYGCWAACAERGRSTCAELCRSTCAERSRSKSKCRVFMENSNSHIL